MHPGKHVQHFKTFKSNKNLKLFLSHEIPIINSVYNRILVIQVNMAGERIVMASNNFRLRCLAYLILNRNCSFAHHCIAFVLSELNHVVLINDHIVTLAPFFLIKECRKMLYWQLPKVHAFFVLLFFVVWHEWMTLSLALIFDLIIVAKLL